MPTAIIIDDSRHDREALKKLLEHHPDIAVMQECENASKGIKAIGKYMPDLVFLDVEMPETDGLQMLAAMDYTIERDFAVIFITAYSKYAVDAIELAALHYLLKPLDPEKLGFALEKFRKGLGDKMRSAQMEVLKHNMGALTGQMMRMAIAFKDKDGNIASDMFAVRDIAYCCSAGADGAKGAYTTFFLHDNSSGSTTTKVKKDYRKLEASKSLNHYDKLLGQHGFIRLGRQYLLNPEYVTRVEKDLVTIGLGKGAQHELSIPNANRLPGLMGPRLLK